MINLISNYKKGYEDWLKYVEETTRTKEQYVCDEVFQITTYDDFISEEIGKDIIKIIKIISEKKNHEYIDKGISEYKEFIFIASMLSDYELVDWGTSIRSCWLSPEGEKLMNFINET